MNYGRDYGNRNFLERAAHTVRGWIGNRGGDGYYDDDYRAGGMSRGYDRGYRETGDAGGYGGGAMRGGYGASNWRGYNDDWNRGPMGGGYRGGEGYRTGGYNASHGGWDVDWDNNRSGGYGADRGYAGGGYGNGGYGGGGYGGGGYARGGERDHYMGRDYTTNHPHVGHDWQSGHSDDATMDMNRGDWNRSGGMMGRGGMSRGTQGGTDRDGDNGRGDWNRGSGMDRGMGGGMPNRDPGVGDASGGTIGNYGAYGSYGIERFRSASGGGVPSGQHFRGYGVGSGYQP